MKQHALQSVTDPTGACAADTGTRMRLDGGKPGRAGRLAARVVLLGLVCACVIGCSPKYHWSGPSASDRRAFDAMTVAGLKAETGAIPGDLPPGPFEAPLAHRHDRYFVSTTLNGHKADLMLDWGSWVTVGLMPTVVRTAGVKLSDAVLATSTLDGEGEMRTGIVDDMVIADADFRGVPFAMSNQELTVTFGGFTVYRGKGMLGLPILAGYGRFAVDLANDRLYFGTIPRGLPSDPDVVTLPVHLDEGMWIDVSVDGVPLRLKVDIGGYSGAMLLEGRAADEFMRAHPSQFAGHATGFGEGVREERAGRAGSVRAGDYELRDLAVHLLPSGSGDAENATPDPQTGGVVGESFFGRTVVGVDWGKGELYFVPAGNTGPPTRYRWR